MSPTGWAFLYLLPLAALGAALVSLRELQAGTGARSGSPLPRVPRAVIAVVLAGVACLATLQLGLAFGLKTDDAPITFRYAENLAAGRGFVYNPGERVLGTSTPLFTILLAALRVVGLPVETSALLIALVSVAAAVPLTLRLGRILGGEAAGPLAAALLCTEAPFLVYATQGMETLCYVALILGALVSHLDGREKTAAALAALCAVMRLDGLAVVAALSASYLLERRVPSRGAVLAFLGLTAPWFGFSWLYFGHLMPQSMIAKLHHTHYSETSWMLRSLFLEATVLFIPFGLLGIALCWERENRARRAAVVCWLALYVIAFSIVPIDAYPWYRIPPIPVLAALAATGIVVSAGALLRSQAGAGRRPVLAALLVALLAAGVARHVGYRGSLAAYFDQLRVWERPRIATAEWLRDHAPAGSTVAVAAIGHIGWISGLRILDTSSLVSPEMMRGFDPGRDRPEFIVGHDGDPLPGAEFRIDRPDYALAATLAGEPPVIYRVYVRKDVALR